MPAMPCGAVAARLLLASASPRRADLLRQAGLSFEPAPTHVDESASGAPAERARVVARRKADAADRPDAFVLAADTLVDLDGTPLGKPDDGADAARMLEALSGRAHEVHTAVALRTPLGVLHETLATTRVHVHPISRAAIDAYVATGECLGKAGGYAIQGIAGAWVSRIDGSFTNVVGLPLAETVALLAKGGFPLPPHLALAQP